MTLPPELILMIARLSTPPTTSPARSFRCTCRAYRALITAEDLAWAEGGWRYSIHGLKNCWKWAVRHRHLKVLEAYLFEVEKEKTKLLMGTLRSAANTNDVFLTRLILRTSVKVPKMSPAALCAAAARGNIDIVSLLLERGAKLQARNKALGWAARRGRSAVVRLLLTSGAKVGFDSDEALRSAASAAASRDGYILTVTALLEAGTLVHARGDMSLRLASQMGHHLTVGVLLQAGANVHAFSDEALVWSSTRGHIGVVRKLLLAGGDAKAQDSLALFRAVEERHISVVEVLLEAGADPMASGGRALRYVLKEDLLPFLRLMVTGGRQLVSDRALSMAVSHGRHIVLEMLEAGANTNGFNSSALISAVRSEDMEVIKILLKRGANVNARDGDPLVLSAISGRTDIVKLLLEAGANVHIRNESALIMAATFCRIDVVKVLLKAGADVHAEDGTALIQTAQSDSSESPELITILLEAGANVQAQNYRALLQNARNGTDDAFITLLNAVPTCSANQTAPATSDRFPPLKMLIEAYSSIRERDDSALIAFASGNRVDEVQRVLEGSGVVTYPSSAAFLVAVGMGQVFEVGFHVGRWRRGLMGLAALGLKVAVECGNIGIARKLLIYLGGAGEDRGGFMIR
ncbi:hypothetical protein HDV00_003947 [Rhizophlyctis rosea]|nr:hypothetical protein HDV00_003947 [Rhizophlyctis rosea]